MNCPSCGGETYVTRTRDHPRTPERIRRCLVCSLQFETLELYRNIAEGQARQATLFHDMVSPESRAKARKIIERNGGGA